mmetsp:Transcript_9109/g.26448  ORF Transcript_9109/g.26448 Transcript_9109/m.26448 type:complete len:212 (-) Transcript_9109:152-787(-)
MDEKAAAKYAEDLAKAGPLGGRGGLGLDAGDQGAPKRKVSAAEKELLGTKKGKSSAGLGGMQTTVARAITHGNLNFDPWKNPVKSSELKKVNTSKQGLYDHFHSAGFLGADAQQKKARSGTPTLEHKANPISEADVKKAVKKMLKGESGSMDEKKLRRKVLGSLLDDVHRGHPAHSKKELKALFKSSLKAGVAKGRWIRTDGAVVLSRRSE